MVGRGFTLVEAAVSIAIVGVMFVAALTTVGSAAGGRLIQSEWRRSDALARALMCEIAQKSYGTTSGTIIGLALPGVTPPTRASFTTIDHYHDMTDAAPRSADGTPLVGYSGWSRTSMVERVSIADPMGESTRSTDHGLKRITVEVRTPGGRSFVLRALRSRWSLAEAAVSGGAGSARAQAAILRLRIGGKSTDAGLEVTAVQSCPTGPRC